MKSMTIARAFAGMLLIAATAGQADALELGWAEKMFEKRSHDFGVVATGAEVSYRFKLTNIYKQQVHISNVRTTCGCSAARPSKNTLNSRETAYIEVTMDTRRFKRLKTSNLIVTFDAPLAAEVTLPIRAYIRTDVVLSPGAAEFGPVEHGSDNTRRININYAGRTDWKIKEVRSDNKHVAARIVEKRRANGQVGYELQVTVKSTAPVGQLRERMLLVTDDNSNPLVPVLVEATVEADITVTPSVISLGTLVPGQTKPFNVVLRARKPFLIEKLECDSATGAFKVRLPKTERPVHVVPITVTPPDKPGKFTEEFSVSIAGRPEPVTFKAYGTIRGGTPN